MSILTAGPRIGAVDIVVGSSDPGPEWDVFMASHPAGHLMQSRAWARVKQDTGWEPIYLRLETEGRMCAGALILRRTVPGIALSLLNIPRGPVLAWDDSGLVEAFASGLQQVARDQKAFLIQSDPAIPQDHVEAHEALMRMGFHREQKHGIFRIAQPIRVMRIPMDRYGGPPGLMAALSRKVRYSIRHAEKQGVVVVPRTDREALQAFYRLLCDTAREKGFAVRGFRFHEAIWRNCIQTGSGEYLFAEHQGRLLAAIQVLRFGKMAWYMYGASVTENRNLRATYLLQWTGISRSWDAGCLCYDLRGVHSADPKPEDPEYGVYAFKRNFGSELVCLLGEYDLVIRPQAYSTWRWLERAVQKPVAWALHLRQKLGGLL